MKPFFTYFGGKYRTALKYPDPTFKTLVEPFAGSAGYAVRHYKKEVVLMDSNPQIYGIWSYLVGASRNDILSLPLQTDDIMKEEIPQAAKDLIGMWFGKGRASPGRSPSAWMRSGSRPKSYWGKEIRERISLQVDQIKHWRVLNCSYIESEDYEATWFIDPPYQSAGHIYKHGSPSINYDDLARWCSNRTGQVIVCENNEAKWLNFEPFLLAKANPSRDGGKVSKEVVWIK